MAELNEVVAEVAEEVADQAEHVAEVSRSLSGRDLAIGFAVGFMITAPLAYWWTNRRLRIKYVAIAEQEIDEMREHFRKRLAVREEKPELETVVEREGYAQPNTPKVKESEDEVVEEEEVKGFEVQIPEEYDPKDIVVEEEAPQAEVRNIFEDEWDYEEEIKLRRPERPYVIHVDERHERDYTESSLIYYEGDDVLADRQDHVIDDVEKVVGTDNLDKFGHGSGDPNIVYVRNDLLAVEMEIVKNDDAYAKVVHGFVQHQYDPDHKYDRRQKQRFDDDPGTE